MGWTRFFHRSRWDAERAAEIDAYIAIETDDNIARGMTPVEARLAAQRKFGNPTMVREEIYRMNTIGFLETSVRDVGFGLRVLRKNPGFTAVAVLSLALGIGANTAIFSLVDTLLVRSLPVQKPEQLVQLGIVPGDNPNAFASRSFSYPIFEEIRDRNQVFAGAFAEYNTGTGDVLVEDKPERAIYQPVSGTYFQVLGVEPMLGRAFSAEEDRQGAPAVAVISHNFWQRRFSLRPDVLGTRVVLRNVAYTIVGVTPPWFTGIDVDSSPDLWVSVTAAVPANRLFGADARSNWSPWILARLKPGVTVSSARPSLDILFSQIMQNDVALRIRRDKQNRISEAEWRREWARKVVMVPASRGISALRRQYTEALMVLMTVVGLVLLIACANIANLLLARATARQREFGIRLAIGAGRARLVRQLLTENLLLAGLGALAGLVFATWAGRTLVALVVGNSVSAVDFRLDLRVLAFTAGVALLTGAVFGLGPALRTCSGGDIHSRLRFRLPVAKVLVVSQVALSLMLVLGAVLFVATLQKLVNSDAGFQRDSVLLAGVEIDPNGPKGERILAAWGETLDRMGALPGVESASVSDHAVFGGGSWTEWIFPEGGGARQSTHIQTISPGYLDTLRIPLRQGRRFSTRDDAAAPKVAIVNETLARRLFPGGTALGKRVAWLAKGPLDVEIVGVVKDLKWRSLREAAPPFIYLSVLQPQASPYPESGLMNHGYLAIRTRPDAPGLAAAVRREIDATHAFSGRVQINTQSEFVDSTLRRERMLAKLSGFFGLIGLMLAAVGLYGLMSYAVSRRTSEIGVRVALGARPGDLIRMVMGETALLVAIGIAAGSAGALALTRFIESFLFGVTRTDPAMTAIAASLLLTVALLAAWLPARRASRVQPMAALRHE